MKLPIGLRKVKGHSMAPFLLQGRVVVITRWYTRPKVGDIVVVKHDGKEKIKRITQLDDKGIFITGDNRLQSTDSYDFGWLQMSDVVAKLLWPKT